MKILYIYRHPDMGFSIGKVFRPIEKEMKKYAEVDSIYLPVANYSLKGLWKNIRYAQKASQIKEYDIIHITGSEHYLIPFLKKQKVVVTVHDLGSMHVKNPVTAFIKGLLFIQTLRFADSITCISEKTQEEVIDKIKILRKKTDTIYDPVGKEFKYSLKEFNDISPTILHIGTKANKNLEHTIRALKGLKCHLRIVGKLTSSQKKTLEKCKITYSNVWGLSDEQILQEYEDCDIVNFPSFYEGFGMPIIEGQSTGRVVLTSNISPMAEVAGGASILVNPHDIDSIRKGYDEAIKNHESYINKGLKNVERFQLCEITKQYFRIYNSIL